MTRDGTPRSVGDRISVNSQEQVAQARMVCAAHSADVAQLEETLDMLGIGPSWQPRSVLPIDQLDS